MEIITLEDYKAYNSLKRPEQDAQLPTLISSANTLITSLIGLTNLETITDTLYLLKSRQKYFLSSSSASAITKIYVLGEFEADYIINNDSYILQPGGVILFRKQPTREGFLIVEYVESSLLPIPADLKLAAFMLVDFWLKQEYREAKTIGGETVTFNRTKSGIPEHIRTIIEVYRRV